MTDLLTRLYRWQKVYPCDTDKPDGHLYEEAHDALTKAIKKLEEIEAWMEELEPYASYGHQRVPVFRDLPELIKELKD